ncbi:hypothetical protein SEUCBS139899_003169 [Sporothrix eucalyptigena]
MGKSELGYGISQAEAYHLKLREQFGRTDMSMFTGLEELTLDNLCKELPWWQLQAAQVLQQNVGSLRRFALFVSPGICFNYTTENNDAPFYDLSRRCVPRLRVSRIYYEEGPIRIGWNAFNGCIIIFGVIGPVHCPNLRWFRVSHYQSNVYAFLAKSAANRSALARQLTISVRHINHMNHGFELAALFQNIDADDLNDDIQFLAPPVHLRML